MSLFYVATLTTAWAQQVNPLPVNVQRALQTANIDPSDVSVLVWGQGETQPRLAWQADEPRNPASLMKLLTTGLALEQWGPAKTWQTEIRRDPVERGAYAASLRVVGVGDPDLSLAHWQSLWRQIYQQGIHRLGDVIWDERTWDQGSMTADGFDGRGFRAYNVVPAALQVEQQTQWWWIRPAAQNGDPVDMWSDFPFPEVTTINHLVTRTGACPHLWRDHIHFVVYPTGTGAGKPVRPNHALDSGVTVEWRGFVRQDCGVHAWGLSVLTDGRFMASTLGTLWHEMGGIWSGRVTQSEDNSSQWDVVASIRSRPLLEILMDMNRTSNNVVARTLWRDLMWEKAQEEGVSWVDQKTAMAQVKVMLAQRGLHFPELVMENGAGLSRQARISAQSLAQWMKWMQESSRYGDEFKVTLPLAGSEGTVKSGFEELQTHYFRLKTGTLDGVKGLAGYGHGGDGLSVVVVFMVNGPHAEQAGEAELALLKWVVSEPKIPQSPSLSAP